MKLEHGKPMSGILVVAICLLMSENGGATLFQELIDVCLFSDMWRHHNFGSRSIDEIHTIPLILCAGTKYPKGAELLLKVCWVCLIFKIRPSVTDPVIRRCVVGVHAKMSPPKNFSGFYMFKSPIFITLCIFWYLFFLSASFRWNWRECEIRTGALTFYIKT